MTHLAAMVRERLLVAARPHLNGKFLTLLMSTYSSIIALNWGLGEQSNYNYLQFQDCLN